MSEFIGNSTFDIQRIKSQTWARNLGEIDELYAELKKLGVNKFEASRIRKYQNAFHSLSSGAIVGQKLGLDLGVRLLNAIVEFHQIRRIVEASKANQTAKIWRPRLAKLVSGAEFPTNEEHGGSARDFQFETFVGAVFQNNGFNVSFEEPDLIVSDASQRIGIAAKRPRRAENLEKNCRKAIKQIRKSGTPGMIALDVSYALKKDQCINTNHLPEANRFITSIVDDFITGNIRLLEKLCAGPWVLGVLVHTMLPVINFGSPRGPQIATVVRWTVVPFFDNMVMGVRWGDELSKKCEIGLFGPRNEGAASILKTPQGQRAGKRGYKKGQPNDS